MFKDLDDIDKNAIECEICIIGSGPAGIAVASKLVKKNIKFIILESGSINPNGEHQKLNKGFSSGPRELNLLNSRLRCFGGAGKLWAGVCRPMSDSDFEKNHRNLSGWPINYSVLEDYYKEAASIFGLDYEAFFNENWRRKASLAVEFDKFAQNDGILKGIDYQRASAEHRDLTNKYQDVLFESKNCNVITNATVIDLIQKNKRSVESVIARSLKGKKININAKKFVLCGGAIENARIMLDSSLNQEIKNNKYLGSCFMSHPAFRRSATLIRNDDSSGCKNLDENLKRDFGFEMNVNEREENQVLRHNIHLSPSIGSPDDDLESQSSIINQNLNRLTNYSKKIKCKLLGGEVDTKFWNLDIAIEQEPRITNYVKLSKNRDLHGKRKVEVFWGAVSDLEMKTVFEAVKSVGRESVLNGVGICKASNDLIKKEIFKQDDSINHHIGTTRMSDSSENGVVDSNLKCFGLSNLFLSGSSVFSTSSIVNPTFTIVALSLRLGEHLYNETSL